MKQVLISDQPHTHSHKTVLSKPKRNTDRKLKPKSLLVLLNCVKKKMENFLEFFFIAFRLRLRPTKDSTRSASLPEVNDPLLNPSLLFYLMFCFLLVFYLLFLLFFCEHTASKTQFQLLNCSYPFDQLVLFSESNL